MIAGDEGIATKGGRRRPLSAALQASRDVIVDLSGLEMADSSLIVDLACLAQRLRAHGQTLWLAGAVLMGVVLAKLLLVDRGHLGNLPGILSFIVFGVMCTVVGYVAPAPPRPRPV